MNLLEIWEKIVECDCDFKILVLAGIIASLVEVSPLHINPWSAVARAIRDALGVNELKEELKRVHENMDSLDRKIESYGEGMDELDRKIDTFRLEEKKNRERKEADDTRRRIIWRNYEITHGYDYDGEMFNSVWADVNFYKHHCQENPDYKNSQADSAIANLTRVYQERMYKQSMH